VREITGERQAYSGVMQGDRKDSTMGRDSIQRQRRNVEKVGEGRIWKNKATADMAEILKDI